MSITAPELSSIISDLRSKHDAAATRVAAMRYLCTNLIDHYSTQTGIDLGEHKAVLDDCIFAYLTDRGVEVGAMHAARGAIDRASVTMAYLRTLPA